MARKQKIDRSSGMVPLTTLEIGLETVVVDNSNSESSSDQMMQAGVMLYKSESGILLIITFTNQDTISTFDFTKYLHRGEIAIGFAEAFYACGIQQRQNTRQNIIKGLKHFFNFIDDFERANSELAPIASLKQITTSLLNAFVEWLNNRKCSLGKNKGHPSSDNTKSNRLTPVRGVITWLKQNRSAKMASDCEIPYNPWPGRARRTIAKSVLPKSTQQLLERACLEEIDEIWGEFEHGLKLIEQALPQLPSKEQVANLDDLADCLAYIKRYYNGLTPSLEHNLKHNDYKLFRAIVRQHGGAEKINRYLCPTVRRLVPFILFITSRTFGNIDSILLMGRNCIYDHPIFPNRKILKWYKPRANQYNKRSYSARSRRNDSVLVIVERVLAMTEVLVDAVKTAEQKKRLFIYYTRTGEANSFENGSSCGTLSNALSDFFHKHNLPKINPSQLRVTGSDRVDELTHGDIYARKTALNHEHVQTTQDFYTSDGIRQRNSERIATLQGEYVNWIRSKGSLDPRVVSKDIKDLSPEQVELIASGQHVTTTGFICKDPLDSPQPEQPKGKVCSAWLGCFTCSNSIIVLDANTLARLLQLVVHQRNFA
ncbi:phage integrase SAM-like domain-containing protein [Oscillatoria sp. FACHB-1407]|uniref:phage integrase SAM-like domain-containing protein n=1 Tax=Oscillatoria sp. FACHB-1407 TaxID=2692847 RepID=UPI00168674BB|nr:phage integrase SAM-like domain-containing protein [Oscillatoria sp. FACHB-1407]MBD2463380.1 phage integrase SAM-like domain-containing protein [Oscillatoria sp. FACHB-1407]